MADRKRRVNGLQPPWHEFQVATWILFPLILVHYYAFLMHLLWRPVAVVIVLTILFSLFAIAAAASAYFTLVIDPIDDAVLCAEVNTTDGGRSNPNSIHCYLCERDVDFSSKHCRFCDKCVLRFDHHCKWLNTCIGKKNYPYFLGVVGSVFLLTTESLSISIALLVEAYAYSDNFMDRMQYHDFLEDRIGSDVSLDALRGLLIASVVCLVGLVGMLVQLGSFHVMLLWRGITTYDFIVSEQKRLRERENQRLQRKVEKQQQRNKNRTVGAAEAGASVGADLSGSGGSKKGTEGARSAIEMRAAAASSEESKRSDNGSFRRYAQVPTEGEAGDAHNSDIVTYEEQQQQHDAAIQEV